MRSIVSDAVVVRAIDDAAALRPARRRLDAVAARPRHGRARVREAAPAGGRAGGVGGEMAQRPRRRLPPRPAHVGLAAALRPHGSRDPVDPARRRQVRAVVPAGVSDAAAHAPRAGGLRHGPESRVGRERRRPRSLGTRHLQRSGRGGQRRHHRAVQRTAHHPVRRGELWRPGRAHGLPRQPGPLLPGVYPRSPGVQGRRRAARHGRLPRALGVGLRRRRGR